MAALCIDGDSEWSTGSPISTSSLLVAAIFGILFLLDEGPGLAPQSSIEAAEDEERHDSSQAAARLARSAWIDRLDAAGILAAGKASNQLAKLSQHVAGEDHALDPNTPIPGPVDE